MSEQRIFKTEDCSFWLSQIATARPLIMAEQGFLQENQDIKFITSNVVSVWISLGLTLVTIVLMFCMGMCKCSLNQMHGILFFWALVQLPVVILSTSLYSLIPNDEAQRAAQQAQDFVGTTIANFAAAQFLIMGLVTTVSMSMTHFKRHHQQMIQHAEIRTRMARIVQSEQRISCIFFVVNFLFQVPLFIFQNVQLVKVSEAVYDDNQVEGQPFNQNIVNTAIAFDIIAILLAAQYILIMLARIPSLCTTIQYGIHNSFSRMMLFIFVPVLMVLYISDVLSMMVFYWGTPAMQMTQLVVQMKDGQTKTINEDAGCMSYIVRESVFRGREQIIDSSFGLFLNVIFNVSEWTPIVWSLVFFFGFLSMMGAERQRRRNNNLADMDQRADLIKQQNMNIHNSQQTMTIEHSRNEMM